MKTETLPPEQRSGTEGGSFFPALCNFIGTLILLLVIAVSVPLSLPRYLGYEVFNVVSGSMAPEIPAGSVVYVSPTDPERIVSGDIIAFRSDGTVVTHRVVRNDYIESRFITRGDANNMDDINPVSYHDLVGIVRYHFPIVGNLLMVYASQAGKMYMLMLAVCGVMFNMVAARMRERRRARNWERLRRQALDPAESELLRQLTELESTEPEIAEQKKKKGRRRRTVRLVIMLILLFAFIGSSAVVLLTRQQYRANQKIYEDAASLYTSRTDALPAGQLGSGAGSSAGIDGQSTGGTVGSGGAAGSVAGTETGTTAELGTAGTAGIDGQSAGGAAGSGGAAGAVTWAGTETGTSAELGTAGAAGADGQSAGGAAGSGGTAGSVTGTAGGSDAGEAAVADGRASAARRPGQETQADEAQDAGRTVDRLAEVAPIRVDFEALRAVNPDVVGWIYCEDSRINYPVVKGESNDYYLHRDVNREHNVSGAIFVEEANRDGFVDANTILYGHHMGDGSMFAGLDYWVKQNYFDAHPVMWLLTPEQDYKIEIFSAYTTSAFSETYTVYPENGEDFSAYLVRAVSKSSPRSDVKLDDRAQYILLSTCAYVFDYARTAVHGVMLPVSSAAGRPLVITTE